MVTNEFEKTNSKSEKESEELDSKLDKEKE